MSAAALVLALVRSVGAVLRNRTAALRLSELDDRMLADIGLSRADLRDAFAELPWRDPSLLLMRRVQERRGLRARPRAR